MTDLFLGFTQSRATEAPVRVVFPEDDRRRSHALVVGAPGSGKSKFLEWMIREDIRARRGLCLIDIHGTLYEDVKRWCAYNAYTASRRIILLDPSCGEYVKGFNPFRPRPGVAVDVQVAGMVQALVRVWGAENTDQTPTLERVLRLLFTLMIVRGIPLHEAHRLVSFGEKEFRAEAIATLDDPVVRNAWEQVHAIQGRADWRAEVLSTENRIFRLASSQTMRRFMGVPDAEFNLDLLQIMEEGAVLLVNLKESPTLTEENARAFAALLLNELFKTAIMFRDEDTRGTTPEPFFVYLDEWQEIATPDVRKILAQARKFGLLLVLANQALAQVREAFSEDFIDTLMTCCQMKACFGGLNRRDAERMASEMLAGQVDFSETNYVLESTKFWPVYQRDHVYSTSSGTGSGMGTSASAAWNPALGEWVESVASSDIRLSSSGESVADVPILMPEPFHEVSQRAVFSRDDQIWRWSDRLMEQYQRHCYVKLPGEATVPLLVPFVQDPSVLPTVARTYEADVQRAAGAESPERVDQRLQAQGGTGAAEPTQASDEDLFE